MRGWLTDLFRTTIERQRKHSFKVTLSYLLDKLISDVFYKKILHRERWRGRNIYDFKWDVLIIIDGCRFDMLKSFEENPSFEFISDVEKTVSLAPQTNVWLKKTFKEEFMNEINQTLYVTGNPQSEFVLRNRDNTIDPELFLEIDEVWKYSWDTEVGTIKPEPITDRTIINYRELNPDRTVVHYMQPHFPSITHPELGSEVRLDKQLLEGGAKWESVWVDLENKNVSEDRVWRAYCENLEYVLHDIRRLINNIDADTVIITSDHGNAVGELGYYGHGHDIPSVRHVPWCITSAKDVENYMPKIEQDRQLDGVSVEER